MTMLLEPFKAAAAEGAALELKLRLLAAKIPKWQHYAYQAKLEDIEADIAQHYVGALSVEEKEVLKLCRQLRNKVLHIDLGVALSGRYSFDVLTDS
jgi:hypothetical protein